jgi:uncharacterized protein (DUF433 family)
MSAVTLLTEPIAVPLHVDEHGRFRVGDTRIPLERVIECYAQGDSPTDIVKAFPDLRLADVFAVLTYYLNHEAEVEAYCRHQREEGDKVRARITASQGPAPGVEKVRAAKRAKNLQ